MVWLIAGALLAIAGFNAPLALCALGIATNQGLIEPRAPLHWLGEPWFIGFAFTLLIIQLLADLYFVPITVRDRSYLNPYRTHNNYLHARVQSLYRPLAGAVIVAALPLPLTDWASAIVGWSVAMGGYWLSAWIREYVAVMRGAIVLLTIETLKNALLLSVAVIVFWLPPLALLVIAACVAPVVGWTLRLKQEYARALIDGGQRVSEDPRVVRSD
jgi:hypothetical protein